MSHNLTVILVETQLPENLGAVARVMANFGLYELRIVNPICNPHDDKSIATATHAASVLHKAKIFNSLENAIADCHLVIGTTAGERDMVKNYQNSRAFFEVFSQYSNQRVAIVFGPERTGLNNEHFVLCNQLISIPTHVECPSMNLSHAVAVVAYDYNCWANNAKLNYLRVGDSEMATFDETQQFFNILEKHLDAVNYWRVPSKKKKMWQNLRNIFTRCHLTNQETKTLIGLVDMLKKSGL